jgi:hypothetical protein
VLPDPYRGGDAAPIALIGEAVEKVGPVGRSVAGDVAYLPSLDEDGHGVRVVGVIRFRDKHRHGGQPVGLARGRREELCELIAVVSRPGDLEAAAGREVKPSSSRARALGSGFIPAKQAAEEGHVGGPRCRIDRPTLPR